MTSKWNCGKQVFYQTFYVSCLALVLDIFCCFIIYAKKSGRVCLTKSTVPFQCMNQEMNNKIYAVKYIPRYQENYFELPWFDRDLMTYVDHLRYQEYAKDSNDYFDRAKIVNFNIIHNRCREDPLTKSMREHETISSDDFVKYPVEVKKSCFCSAEK